MSEVPDKPENHPDLRLIIGLIFFSYILSAVVILSFTEKISSYHLVLGEVLFFAPVLLFLVKKKYNLKLVLRIKSVNWQILSASALLGFSTPVFLDEIDRIISKFIAMPPEYEQIIADLFVAKGLHDWLYLIIGGVLLAGFIEEMLFRGLLQRAFENRFEPTAAIFFSAFVFALVHPTAWLVQVLVTGLFLGYLAWRSQSILPCIILHCFNNGFSLAFTNFNVNLSWYDWYSHVHPTVLATAACVTFYAIKWFNSNAPKPQREEGRA